MSTPSVIAVDAMSGDAGPLPVVRGMERLHRRTPELRFVLSGDETVLERLLRRRRSLRARCDIRHAPDIIQMTESPRAAYGRRESTSMWHAIGAVVDGTASVAISCGNTGALAVMATAALKSAASSVRPAIAALWPTRTRNKFTVMLDMGAHYTATAEELRSYAIMGAEYARAAMDVEHPRLALLNIGAEKLKGHPEVREADELISQLGADERSPYQYIGFVEGDQLTADLADVIVTDGFTGNVALKTAEGIARFIRDVISATMRRNILSRAAAMLAYPTFRGLRNRLDPRRMNGGVLLGLNGVVVKSHGRADSRGIEAALELAHRVAKHDLPQQIATRLQQFAPTDAANPTTAA